MPISPVTFPDISALTSASGLTSTPSVTPSSAVDSSSATDFGNLVLDGIDRLQSLQNTSSDLAVQAATGDATAIHSYTIAAMEASTATQLAVTLRNQAISSFNSILNLQF